MRNGKNILRMQADEEDVEGRDGANHESNLPAETRDHQVGDAGSDKPADTPEALEQYDEAAAQMARCIFTHERRCDRQFATKTKAHEEAEDEQGFIAPSQCAESR